MRPTSKKGLNDIPTYSARLGQSHNASRIYMQITCLEMEKIRLNKEQECTQRRIDTITSRLTQIEQEKKDLLCSLQEERAIVRARSTVSSAQIKKTPSDVRGGFRIKY